jgi:hypothetical protein
VGAIYKVCLAFAFCCELFAADSNTFTLKPGDVVFDGKLESRIEWTDGKTSRITHYYNGETVPVNNADLYVTKGISIKHPFGTFELNEVVFHGAKESRIHAINPYTLKIVLSHQEDSEFRSNISKESLYETRNISIGGIGSGDVVFHLGKESRIHGINPFTLRYVLMHQTDSEFTADIGGDSLRPLRPSNYDAPRAVVVPYPVRRVETRRAERVVPSEPVPVAKVPVPVPVKPFTAERVERVERAIPVERPKTVAPALPPLPPSPPPPPPPQVIKIKPQHAEDVDP